jgi:hypothetical protein
MHSAAALRRELSVRGQQIAAVTDSAHELMPGEMPSVIFGHNENWWHEAAKTGMPCERCTVRETRDKPVSMDFA